MTLLKGRGWVFDDNVSTEYMMPGFTMLAKMQDDEAKLHCMAALRPEFARNVKPGDIVVGGENFGCGSSRVASRLLLALGISCVLAESFAGLFYRNGINTGLPLIESRGIRTLIREGDLCQVDLSRGTIENCDRGSEAGFPPFPPHVLQILAAGGLIPLLKSERAGAGGHPS